MGSTRAGAVIVVAFAFEWNGQQFASCCFVSANEALILVVRTLVTASYVTSCRAAPRIADGRATQCLEILQQLTTRFIPTDKRHIRELWPMMRTGQERFGRLSVRPSVFTQSSKRAVRCSISTIDPSGSAAICMTTFWSNPLCVRLVVFDWAQYRH